MNVLNDDVLGTVGDAKTLAPDDTSATNTDNTLVTLDLDGLDCSFVVGDTNCRVARRAPVGLVDGILTTLARACVALGTAALSSSGTLRLQKIELFVDEDGALDLLASLPGDSELFMSHTEEPNQSTMPQVRRYP